MWLVTCFSLIRKSHFRPVRRGDSESRTSPLPFVKKNPKAAYGPAFPHTVKPAPGLVTNLYSETTPIQRPPKSGNKRPPPIKDYFFLAQTWSLNTGFTVASYFQIYLLSIPSGELMTPRDRFQSSGVSSQRSSSGRWDTVWRDYL
jgi:hypothetical protein